MENVRDVINNGAEKIAVVRAIINAENPANAAGEFLEIMKKKERAHV